ncbi:ABC transporter permease/M1 family aminopeptidase [Archangium violaceum]|uniref:Putative membrane protein n=1 Tax=Archangium violaceum Cb vi76 TaxID=1406225 RepID=A0A084T084_9BACT|nr:membrane protein [Archangium violaceum]KFA94119.1 putative membrane protein [Archangium violaceum Cb vi76]
MKFLAIFRFELAYQGRRAWPWLFFAVLLVFDFLMTRDASLSEALYEDFFLNSSFAIAKTTVFGSLIWLLVAAPVAGDAAARDVAAGMHPLIYTVPVSKAEYLGGRFLAALVLNSLILLAVPVGILLAVYAPGVDAEAIGPFRPAAYLTAYAFIALPNAFVATALQFSLATWSGRATASYLGSLLLFFMAFFVASVVLFKRGLGTLLDPIGIRFIVEDLSHSWTTNEKSWRLLALKGTVLTNRLLWLGMALGALAITSLRFRFAHRTERRRWRRGMRRRDAHSPMSEDIGVTASAPISVPRVPRTFGFAFHVHQTLAIAWMSFRTIATSWAGLALLVGIPMLTVPVVLDQMVSIGAPLVPTTARVLSELTAPLSAELSHWVIIPLLIVFFAGELVWRERDAGLGEITGALPGSEWAPLLGKFLGLGLVLAVFMALLTTAGMLAQVIRGYQDFELGLYLKVLLGLQLPEYLLFALLALVVHVLVDQKYVGHLVAIMAFVFIAVLAAVLGIEHNLLVYGAGPGWTYTEMRGFGPFLGPWLWFKLYWAAWALLLAVVARLLWVRGKERVLGVRLRLARHRFMRPTAWVAGAAAVLILMLGGFIFYNTNVLNPYLSGSDITERRAEYERRYRRYESIPQPQLTGTHLRVEIYPERRAVEIRGSYRLVNGSALPIDSIHVATAMSGVETRAVTFDRTATLAVDDADHGHRLYAFERPLEPGDTLRLDFEVHVEQRGFGNRGVDPSVVANGTSFTHGAWFPSVGYQRHRELVSASDRRAHGLEPRPVIASLSDVEAREPASRGGGSAFEAVVGTDEDQVAVAPGALRRAWTEGGRRYFHYSSDAPIGSEWAFFSADYAVHEGQWKDVAIRIFHHPEHTAHLDRVMRSVRASLGYYTEQFGPYPYRHLSIVEHPGRLGTGLHAEPSMLTHGEGFPFWSPEDEERSLDFPSAVVAHEMAHQWTLPYALVEGAPFLSEGLAWYSAMQAVKASRGEEQLRRLLAFMRQPHPYPPIRRGEPLLRALDPYLAYRRGPFAMYALSEYVGSEQVNLALRRLIEKHDAAGAPRATTLDLYRELRAVTPDSLKPLLHDLFEVNTIWEFKTERAMAEQLGAGTWQVTLDVRARKVVYDSTGVETEVPMDEDVPIGVFGPAGEGAGGLSAPLDVRLHRIRSGEQTITVTVPREPVLAGIDPYHLLDWEERADDDNIEAVKARR